jgi:hypothetical protein
MTDDKRTIKVEHLVHWYLRLNGFMTVNDFVLHRDHKPWGQRTDADIFGVRFPFRKELNLEDDPIFSKRNKPLFIIGEITRGECKLNGPWTDPSKQNMQYVLNGIGAFEPHAIDPIAQSLYERYSYEDDSLRINLVAFGKAISSTLSDPDKPVIQITIDRMTRFIFQRFRKYWIMKKDHQHWDYTGLELWNLAEKYRNSEDEFAQNALRAVGLTAV